MSQKTIVDFLEEWQTGFFFVLGAAVVGVLGALVGGWFARGAGVVVGFVLGVAVGFLLISFLLYGRR